MSNSTIKGKNCFISGATGGLGECLASELLNYGCNLYLTGRNKDKLEKLEYKLQSIAHNEIKIHSATCDLSNTNEIINTANNAIDVFGHIDILVNCAGVFMVKPLSDSTDSDYNNIFNVNIRSSIHLSKIFSDQMKINNWGRIINIGSSSSLKGSKNTTLYCASKHALLGFSRALQDELKSYDIRTFCFMPGSIKTDMGNLVPDQSYDTFLKPEEVAEYIVYVASIDSELYTGEISLERFNMS